VNPLILSECIPSAHFLEKKEARGVDWQTIRAALENPGVVEETEHNGRKALRYVHGEIAIVVVGWFRDHPILVTVLLRESKQWTDEDVRNRMVR
jgi:hypothetical protein